MVLPRWPKIVVEIDRAMLYLESHTIDRCSVRAPGGTSLSLDEGRGSSGTRSTTPIAGSSGRATPSTKLPARRWPLRGRKQLDAFERNLSPSQKHGLFTKATPGCCEMTQAEEGNRQVRQEIQSREVAPSASFRDQLPRGLRVGFAIERTLALLAALAVFNSTGAQTTCRLRPKLDIFAKTRGFSTIRMKVSADGADLRR
jgi:hypothetical protein